MCTFFLYYMEPYTQPQDRPGKDIWPDGSKQAFVEFIMSSKAYMSLSLFSINIRVDCTSHPVGTSGDITVISGRRKIQNELSSLSVGGSPEMPLILVPSKSSQ